MNDILSSVDHARIDARARQLRAEATREGILAMRRAVVNVFVSLSLRSAKTA